MKKRRYAVVRLSAETHEALAALAKGFETPNNTIRRLLGLPAEGYTQPGGPACPRCGEDDIDALVWIDDRRVRCISCKHAYAP